MLESRTVTHPSRLAARIALVSATSKRSPTREMSAEAKEEVVLGADSPTSMSFFLRFISEDDAICALCMWRFTKTTITELAMHFISSHPKEALHFMADEYAKGTKLIEEKSETLDGDLLKVIRQPNYAGLMQGSAFRRLDKSAEISKVDDEQRKRFPYSEIILARPSARVTGGMGGSPLDGAPTLRAVTSVAMQPNASFCHANQDFVPNDQGQLNFSSMNLVQTPPAGLQFHPSQQTASWPTAACFQFDSNRKEMPNRRGRPTENPCWGYFDRLDEQNVRCRLCGKVVKSACATNMTKHLERHHREEHLLLLEHIQRSRCLKAPPTKALSESPSFTAPSAPSAFPFFEPTSSMPALPISDDLEFPLDYEVFERCKARGATTDVDLAAQLERGTQFDVNPQQAWNTGIQSWPGNSFPSAHPPRPLVTISSAPLATDSDLSGERRCRPYIKRNRKTEHPVWQFFVRRDEGDARCTLCAALVRSPCSSNFMRHLMRHHTVEYQRVYSVWLQKRNEQAQQ